jgi:hypothetical protein
MNIAGGKLLTGNELRSGAVVWWAGSGWSLVLAQAVVLDEPAAAALLAEHAPAGSICDLAIVDAIPGSDGPEPRTARERIRGHGPTIAYGPITGLHS